MLVRLFIENYALIEQLEITFSKGFSVITGETGAGKSILLGALQMLLGQRADVQVLRDKNKKCVIEGSFDIRGYELEAFFELQDLDFQDITLFRREINPQGKSRTFINDSPVNVSVLKEISEQLINIHSQHEVLTLHQTDFQQSVVDHIANLPGELKFYRKEYNHYKLLESEIQTLREQEAHLKLDADYRQFLWKELETAAIQSGEYETVETQLNFLLHATEVRTALEGSIFILSDSEQNVISQLNQVKSILAKHAQYLAPELEILPRLESAYLEIKDINAELQTILSVAEANPEAIETLSSRLDFLQHLMQKHQVDSTDKLLLIQDELSKQLLDSQDLSELIAHKEEERSELEQQLHLLADQLHQKRMQVIPEIEKELKRLFGLLAMPDACIQIQITETEDLHNSGKDQIRFLFSANLGFSLQDISKVASGGESSRVLLAIKSMISRANVLPTIIFDEIDTGVSGKVASHVAQIMKNLGQHIQVIAITHLPQIAAAAEGHYLVYKQKTEQSTYSGIRKLDDEEHIKEIARILSGDQITEVSLQAARQLTIQ